MRRSAGSEMTQVLDTYLVDTGVFARWSLEQVGFQHALEVQSAFLGGEVALETVDMVRIELANVLRKKGLLEKHLDRDEYLTAVRAIDDLGITVHSTDVDALERAAALAADRMLRLFDALVVDRALERGLTLLTSDARLCRSVDRYLSTELLRGIV